ncbi:MAG: uL15 family ribosomal protein [Candidatus Pacearchaeota archaeon]|jgi:large subunit ribosomal protein L15
MKTKKRKKSSRMHGHNMGTHGGGARKKRKGSGHRGGIGMSGSGKRADHKKTLINKLYGHKYFGKQGITSRGTKRDTRQRINLRDIQLNLKKYEKNGILDLSKYKILGTGEVTQKLKIKALEASKSAIEKVKKAGGEIILPLAKEEKVVEKKEKVEKSD